MIQQSPGYLQHCYKISRAGPLLSFSAGDVVARGFADVGFECFYIRHDLTLVSLLSGAHHPLPEAERHHYFLIPSADDLIGELRRLGVEQVAWEASAGTRTVVARGQRAGGSFEVTGSGVAEALLFLLASCLDLPLGNNRPALVPSRAVSL